MSEKLWRKNLINIEPLHPVAPVSGAVSPMDE